MLIQCGCLSNYCLQNSHVTNNLESIPGHAGVKAIFSLCWVRSGFSWKHFTVAKMTAVRKKEEFLFSGEGKPPNPLGKQVALKDRITLLCSLLQHTISTKRHQFHSCINNSVRDLWGKHTALGKVSVNRADVESCKRLIWRLYSQYVSGIHVHSVFKFY